MDSLGILIPEGTMLPQVWNSATAVEKAKNHQWNKLNNALIVTAED